MRRNRYETRRQRRYEGEDRCCPHFQRTWLNCGGPAKAVGRNRHHGALDKRITGEIKRRIDFNPDGDLGAE